MNNYIAEGFNEELEKLAGIGMRALTWAAKNPTKTTLAGGTAILGGKHLYDKKKRTARRHEIGKKLFGDKYDPSKKMTVTVSRRRREGGT